MDPNVFTDEKRKESLVYKYTNESVAQRHLILERNSAINLPEIKSRGSGSSLSVGRKNKSLNRNLIVSYQNEM